MNHQPLRSTLYPTRVLPILTGIPFGRRTATPNDVIGGQDAEGTPIYVVREELEGYIVPGWARSNEACHIVGDGEVETFTDFQILQHDELPLHWGMLTGSFRVMLFPRDGTGNLLCSLAGVSVKGLSLLDPFALWMSVSGLQLMIWYVNMHLTKSSGYWVIFMNMSKFFIAWLFNVDYMVGGTCQSGRSFPKSRFQFFRTWDLVSENRVS